MDYQALSMLIPKSVQTWTFVQIRKWLHFIHMQKLLPLFETNNFNGQLLSRTTIKTLSQIGVNSNIMQKKLMVWIEIGFVQFNEYLRNANCDKQNISPNSNFNQRKTFYSKPTRKISNLPFPPMSQQPCSNKLTITNFQGPKTVHYIVDRKGLRIGRSTQNEIQSLQITVENNHAQVIMKNNEFYLIDLATKSGTFIKVHYKIQLTQGMLVEIGTYLLKVKEFSNLLKQVRFQCRNIVTGVIEELNVDLSQKPTYSLGRRVNNDFARDDQHMSGTHAKIYYFNGKFILQDMGSTNGTWLRLSEINKKSTPHKLSNDSIFKIGNTITYICSSQSRQRNQSKMQIQENSHICINCNQNQRNILFLPCKHTISCENCCIEYSKCPLCRHQVEEKIKIFI